MRYALALLLAASALLLDRRTLHRAEGTEYAAIAQIGAQQGITVAALIEELAGIRRHAFLFGESAMRTCQDGLKNDGTHRGVTSVYVISLLFLNISQLLLSSHAIERLQFKISNLKLTNLSFLGY